MQAGYFARHRRAARRSPWGLLVLIELSASRSTVDGTDRYVLQADAAAFSALVVSWRKDIPLRPGKSRVGIVAFLVGQQWTTIS